MGQFGKKNITSNNAYSLGLSNLTKHNSYSIGENNSSDNMSYSFGRYNFGLKSGNQKGNESMVLNLRKL